MIGCIHLILSITIGIIGGSMFWKSEPEHHRGPILITMLFMGIFWPLLLLGYLVYKLNRKLQDIVNSINIQFKVSEDESSIKKSN